jgi:hypothetical protein
MSLRFGQVLISTEDYCFEGLFACIEGSFPNYMKIIPEITEKTQWFTLCAASLRTAIDSVKSLMGQDRLVHLNAENPERLNIIIAEGLQTLKIEGTASRPMRLGFTWDILSDCLLDWPVLTKFWVNSSKEALITHEDKAGKGLDLDVTKVFVPLNEEDKYAGCDNFHIPLPGNEDGEESSN